MSRTGVCRPAQEGHSETPEAALAAAARQIRARRYAEELRAAGASPVHEMAVVFDGKRVWVERLDPADGSTSGAL